MNTFRSGLGRKRLPLAAGLLALACTFVLAACGGSKESSTAPNFKAADLAETASDNWVTNGGSSWNQRYSSLDDIDASNVSQVKGVWRTHLNGSGIAPKYSGEGQPVEYNGVLYVTTGNDDVFAVSVETGKILWEHKSNISQEITTICCGWLNRGVGLGDGRVYLGQLDGKVVALDQKTGEPVWTRQLVSWQRGQTITGAPLYMDGKIYIGTVGAEYGTRNFLEAMDAKTGKSVWRFYTVPGPNDPGGDTWPAGTDEYLHGGAPVWSTPSVDKDAGLMYITTGNAGNDWFGGDRPGDNLYAASIVALDIETGQVKWHFQEVHHDIWDYDTPSPAVLFDVDKDGKTIKGLGVPGKTGWLYLLDRTTGEALYGIDEKPVPQDAEQKTAKTQPIPRTGEFIPHTPAPAADVARVKGEITGPAKKVPVVVAQEMFTPPTTKTMLIYGPGPMGGNNWQPSSYNQKTHMFYVCAARQYLGVQSANNPFTVGKSWTGVGAIAGIAWPEASGTFTAIDATSGEVVWQKTWPDACYSTTSTTAGNVVFVGRNAGELQAYNAENGDLLWSFQTGAGANNAPTIFEHDGKEYLAYLSAGNSLMATAHGDSVWLFGLDGTMGPAATPGKGQGTEHKGEGGGKSTSNNAGDATAGKAVFNDNCAVCHGALATGGNGGPDLTAIPAAKSQPKVVAQVLNGGGGMPAFKGQLSTKQVNDVSAYVTEKLTNK
jgi:quinohemoprotein ethanol dehydrogenase